MTWRTPSAQELRAVVAAALPRNVGRCRSLVGTSVVLALGLAMMFTRAQIV